MLTELTIAEDELAAMVRLLDLKAVVKIVVGDDSLNDVVSCRLACHVDVVVANGSALGQSASAHATRLRSLWQDVTGLVFHNSL